MTWQNRAKQLAADHWDYHDIMVPVFIADFRERQKVREDWSEWYKAIALHFYKHAVEDIEAGIIEVNRKEQP